MFDLNEIRGTETQDAARGQRMLHIEIIQDYDRFLELKGVWQALERDDVDAHLYLSWNWLSRIFRDNPGQWRIVVVRDGMQGRAVAILPLKVSAIWAGHEFISRMESAACLLGGTGAGFLCRSAEEGLAAKGLCEALSNMAWGRLDLSAPEGNARLRRLARLLGKRDGRISLRRGERTGMILPLAEGAQVAFFAPDAERVLSTQRATFLGNSGWRVRVSRKDQLDADLAGLIGLADRFGIGSSEDLRARIGNAVASGDLMVQAVWEGGTLRGGIVHVCDHEANTLRVLADVLPEGDALSPEATLLRGASALWAARHGFGAYDFGDLPHPDAAALGANRVYMTELAVERHVDAPRFDPSQMPLAMVALAEMVSAGDAQATRAARALSLGSA